MSSPPNINWYSMSQVQIEITRWAQERFPHRTDHHAIHKLMVEEIPELAMHKKEHGTTAIGTELADCFILLFDLASLWNVDVARAIQEKMLINYDRLWDMDVNGIMQHVPLQDDSNPPRQLAEPVIRARLCVSPAGIECPKCHCDAIETAATTSIYLYHCQLCDHYFDDDIPF